MLSAPSRDSTAAAGMTPEKRKRPPSAVRGGGRSRVSAQLLSAGPPALSECRGVPFAASTLSAGRRRGPEDPVQTKRPPPWHGGARLRCPGAPGLCRDDRPVHERLAAISTWSRRNLGPAAGRAGKVHRKHATRPRGVRIGGAARPWPVLRRKLQHPGTSVVGVQLDRRQQAKPVDVDRRREPRG